MDDLISRQAAIDAIKGLPTWWADEGGYYGGAQPPMEALLDPEDAVSAIENLPSAQPEQRWIPCSERLPEVYKDVLICWDFKGNREVLIGNMYSDGTFHGYDDEYLTHNGRKYRKAVAWMPLPEPYKGEGEAHETD